jgi:hypothetical protein
MGTITLNKIMENAEALRGWTTLAHAHTTEAGKHAEKASALARDIGIEGMIAELTQVCANLERTADLLTQLGDLAAETTTHATHARAAEDRRPQIDALGEVVKRLGKANVLITAAEMALDAARVHIQQVFDNQPVPLAEEVHTARHFLQLAASRAATGNQQALDCLNPGRPKIDQ